MVYIWDRQELKISFGCLDLSTGWGFSEFLEEDLNGIYLTLMINSGSFLSLSEVIGTEQRLLITYNNKTITNRYVKLLGRNFSLNEVYPEVKFTFSL